ncbi:MAG: coproporphyrinogen-III oxidase family protein, partial [Vicinamibacterales bacterium]
TLLERDHREADIVSAVERLRPRIGNISLDLIFGVPGQSLDSWEQSLSRTVKLQPTHVSAYGLTFEKGTAFWSRRRQGTLTPLPDDRERAMYAQAMDRLPAAGLEQYELSNFARPGFRCRHNEGYWQGRPHFAFGPGAVSYLDGMRATNHRSVTTWLRRVLAGQSPIAETERLEPEDRARELLVIGLRTCGGVDRDDFRRRTGFDLHALAGEAIRKHQSFGLLEDDARRLRLTREGRFVADSVIVDLL